MVICNALLRLYVELESLPQRLSDFGLAVDDIAGTAGVAFNIEEHQLIALFQGLVYQFPAPAAQHAIFGREHNRQVFGLEREGAAFAVGTAISSSRSG